MSAKPKKEQRAESYSHDDEALLRPDVGTQAAEPWFAAVNADGTHGDWRYAIVHEMNLVTAAIDEVLG